MKERLHTLVLALAALATLWVFFVPKPTPASVEFARPLSTETRPDGLVAAANWLRSDGVPVESLRTRYRSLLAAGAAPAAGNVLVTHVPHALAVRASERAPLQDWIRRGNTLVIAVALNDTPGWASNERLVDSPLTTLEELAGMNVQIVQDPPGAAEDDTLDIDLSAAMQRYEVPLRTIVRPSVQHPLVEGIREVVAESDYPTNVWEALQDEDVRLALADARTVAPEPAPGDAAAKTAEATADGKPRPVAVGQGLWLVPRGEGRVIVVGVASAFTNRVLGTADNARLFERLVVGSLGPGGIVYFDDAHQGASSLYTPAAFATDPRLWWSVAIVVALWFAWALGVQRLGLPPPPPGRPGEDVLVRGAAGHFARRGGVAEAARRMFAHFRARVAWPAAASEDDAWAALAARRPEAVPLVAAARALEQRVRDGKKIDVRRLRRTLLELERFAK